MRVDTRDAGRCGSAWRRRVGCTSWSGRPAGQASGSAAAARERVELRAGDRGPARLCQRLRLRTLSLRPRAGL